MADKVHLLGGIFRPQIDVQDEHGVLDIASKERGSVFCTAAIASPREGGRLDELAINLLPGCDIHDYQPDTGRWGDGPAILFVR